LLNWLYTAVSWILLRWHDLWSAVFDGRAFLATNWDWILAIIFLVITVRVLLFPIFVKQIKSQRAMQALQPKMKELREKHGDDREALQRELLELYRQEKVNPMMGCLPMFLQVPVFISLFWVLRRLDPTRERMTDLYTWTHDQFIDASLATLFNAPIASRFFDDNFIRFADLGTNITTVRIVTGVLTVIMMITTYFTSRQMILKTGWATDPQQLMIQRLMIYGLPFMLLFSGLFFPLGVILYWVTNNLISLAQQQWVLRKYPPVQTATAGVTAASGAAKGAASKTGKGTKGAPAKGEKAQSSGVDGRSLAPKPGAKPVHPKKKVPPKRPSSSNIPPKRKSSTPRKR